MKNIILDVDPGYDDALAIILASHIKKINILGITAVNGNVSLDKTVKNAALISAAIGLNVPVYKGKEKPLCRDIIHCEKIHGITGLDGVEFSPEIKQSAEKLIKEESAIDFIIESIEQRPGKIIIVAVGPLTNIATVLKQKPTIVKKIKQLVIMGCGINTGNITPYAEFNTFCDPEAAAIVYKSKVPIFLIPLDLTKTVVIPEYKINLTEKKFNEKQKNFNLIAESVLMNYSKHTQLLRNERPALHDPCCIVYLIKKSFFKFKYCQIEINTKKESAEYGKSLITYTHRKTRIKIATQLNKKKIFYFLNKKMGFTYN